MLTCSLIFIVTAVINRSVNMTLSVSVAERMTDESFTVNISWKQLLSQELVLFLANSVDNETVYDSLEYIVHFESIVLTLNDSRMIPVDGDDFFHALSVNCSCKEVHYRVWITIDVLLVNGSTVHLQSPTITTLIPACSVGYGTHVYIIVNVNIIASCSIILCTWVNFYCF